jgi:hypothetical protein
MKIFRNQLILLFILLVSALACEKNVQSTVIGRWEDLKNGGGFEFLSDNTVMLPGKRTGNLGKWNILNDGRIKVELNQNGKTDVVGFFRLRDSDTLTWKSGEGTSETLIFRKIKPSQSVASIYMLRTALDLFQFDVGRYPTEKEGLKALIQNPSGIPKWQGPYVDKISNDLEIDFIYKFPGVGGLPYSISLSPKIMEP